MAIQTGVLELSGKIGDLIFTQGKKRTYVSKKSDRPYQLSENSKKSAKDLAEASKHSKIVRTAFARMTEGYKDSTVYYRLNKRFLEVLKSISREKLGEKKVKDGDTTVLEGFRFNQPVGLDRLLYKLPDITIEPSGALQIDLQVEPEENITKQVKNADKVVLQIGVFSQNLDDGNYQYVQLKDLVKPRLKSAKTCINFNLKGEILLLVVMGVHYLKNGCWLTSERINAAEITHVFRLSDGKIVEFVTALEEEKSKPSYDEGLEWDEEE